MAIYGIVIDKLLEITRDPFFEDIAWEYCVFGAVQMGEEEGGEDFFKSSDMGAQSRAITSLKEVDLREGLNSV